MYINEIQFGILSPDEIKKMAVCEVNHTKFSGPNSVYDERMGSNEPGSICITCSKTTNDCPGHYGYISLSHPVSHPLYQKSILHFLKCFCHKCFRVVFSKERLDLLEITDIEGPERFEAIVELSKNVDACTHLECGAKHPSYFFNSLDDTFCKKYKIAKKIHTLPLHDSEIISLFENISDDEIRLLGLDPKFVHPKNMILTVFPVIPPRARPYVITGGNICDDDLTIQYVEMIKTIKQLKNPKINQTQRTKYTQGLRFRIQTIIDNSKHKAKHTNGRPMKGIKERISGKPGIIRSNILAKRVCQSSRTVIGPDPTLEIDQIAVPEQIANHLSMPVRVNQFNREYLEKLIYERKVKFVHKNGMQINPEFACWKRKNPLKIGDVIIRGDQRIDYYMRMELLPGDLVERDGKIVDDKDFSIVYHPIELSDGDIVDRVLMDNDRVIINRQPTLHRGSMISYRILVRPNKTFRLNLACTKMKNADKLFYPVHCRQQEA